MTVDVQEKDIDSEDLKERTCWPYLQVSGMRSWSISVGETAAMSPSASQS